MLRIMLYIFLSLNLFVVRGQVVFYQDICKCGVTVAGFSIALNSGNNIGEFDIHIEQNSTIKRAFLFSHRFGLADPVTIQLNNNNFVFNDQNRVSPIFLAAGTFFAKEQAVHVIDVTNLIDPNEQTYSVTFPSQNSCVGCSFGNVFLVVIYENSNFNENLSTYILLNDQNESFTNNFSLTNLNSKNNLFPVLFSIYSDRIGNSEPFDGSVFKLNNNQIGIIKGADNVNSTFDGGGVKGHFYYQNTIAIGLDDDNENTVINNSDGIMDVGPYILSNSLSWQTQWETNSAPYNIFSGFFLTYTTPCAEFPTQTSTDTTLCEGTTAQLFASGGTSTGSAPAYSWQPATGLSCTDCPNPIVTADSSRLYTVRIWNNDSCSVVRPIKVNVQPLPQFSGVGSTPTACGQNTGSAIAVAQNTTPLPLSYSINGAPFAFSSTYTGNFANLSAGANTIILRDAFGCETDTVIQIGVTNTTNAFFTATPNSGAAPLSVSFSNQSTNATNYSWFIESDFLGDNLLQHTFDTSGNYTVTLIAWQNDPLCSDTFSLQIVVYDSLIIQIPNVFTPNGDGINDIFTITTNQPVSVEYHLFNRWGNVIAQDTKATTAGNSNFVLPIWDGENYSDGTYFYVIRVVHDGKEYEFDGFLERIE